MVATASENQASHPAPVPWIRRAASAAALLLLVIAGAELTVRIEDWLRWGTPLLAAASSVDDLAISDSTGRHPAPGRAYRKWRINALGTRGPESDPAAASRRVLILGASESFGLYESPDHEYARQLSDTLTRSACQSDVLNAAFPGMSLPTVEQDFRLRVAALAPKVVIYYPTPPQYLDDALPRAAPLLAADMRAAGPSPWHLRFTSRARDAFKAMLPRPVLDVMRRRDITQSRASLANGELFTTIPADRLAAFETDLRRLVGTIRSRGASTVLVTHANAFIGSPPAADDRLRAWERFYPRASGTILVAFDSAAAVIIRQVAADSGTGLVDAWQGFHGAPADSLFGDFSHFTDAGAAKMAGLLGAAVKNAAGCDGKQP